MADKFPKFPPIRGIASYPHLVQPDTKFNPDGDYRSKLRVPAERAAKLIARMEEVRDEFVAGLEPKDRKKIKRQHDLYETEVDDEGEETGNLIFSFKTHAQFTSRKTGEVVKKKIRFFDSFNQPVTIKAMWSGSDIVVAGTIGVSVVQGVLYTTLRPEAVQIVRLVEGGGGNADSYGFEAVADGFSGSTDDGSDDAGDGDSKDSDGEGDEEF